MKAKRTVLLALADAHHGFVKGAARYAREHRWHLVTDMVYSARIPFGWRGDGIISFIGRRDDLAEFILFSRLPTVEISMIRNDIDLPRVEGDNEMIGQLAAEYFLGKNYRNFVWAPFGGDIVNTERYRGFANRLTRENLPCHVLPVADYQETGANHYDWSAHRRILTKAMRNLHKPLAAFCYNDIVAANLIDVCDDAGLLVPEEVAVLGVDNNTVLCDSLRIPLSSVCHDLEELAYQAAALLDQLMAGEKAPEKVVWVRPKGIVTRRSTDSSAVGDPKLAGALRFIHAHYSSPFLGVDDIVAATKVSRRSLEKSFRTVLNRSVHEEIIRVRMEQVKRLLASTEDTVAEISAQTGFTRVNHLFRIFREQVGTTPAKYRAQEGVSSPRDHSSDTQAASSRTQKKPGIRSSEI